MAGSNSLTDLLCALEKYPAPIPVALEAHVAYIPPLTAAIHLYARRFQHSESEDLILEAFVAVAPKILERCQALIAKTLDGILDNTDNLEFCADRMLLIDELSSLAAVFTGTCESQYIDACDMIKRLIGIVH